MNEQEAVEIQVKGFRAVCQPSLLTWFWCSHCGSPVTVGGVLRAGAAVDTWADGQREGGVFCCLCRMLDLCVGSDFTFVNKYYN